MLQHKMVANRDFTEIEAQFANMYALAVEHKADLVVAVHPFQDLPDFAGNTRTLFTTGDALGRFEVSFWTARKDYIAAHRAVLVDLLEDYVRAIRWFDDPKNRDEAYQCGDGECPSAARSRLGEGRVRCQGLRRSQPAQSRNRAAQINRGIGGISS